MQLFYWPEACSIAPHILLYESQKPFKALKPERGEDGLLSEEFRRLNPKARVPVLVLDDETIITESTAILVAIAQTMPERHLLGRTDLEMVRVLEWMNWLSGGIHGQVYGPIFRPDRIADDPSMHEAIRAKGKEAAIEQYGLIEEKLTGEFAVGQGMTIVDPFLFVLWRWATTLGIVTKKSHPKYARLIEDLMKRPSVNSVLDAEGITAVVL